MEYFKRLPKIVIIPLLVGVLSMYGIVLAMKLLGFSLDPFVAVTLGLFTGDACALNIYILLKGDQRSRNSDRH